VNLKKGETTMYTVSDVEEMGNAQELILSLRKVQEISDDADPETEDPEEYFDR
jgi:hypothetical protein